MEAGAADPVGCVRVWCLGVLLVEAGVGEGLGLKVQGSEVQRFKVGEIQCLFLYSRAGALRRRDFILS